MQNSGLGEEQTQASVHAGGQPDGNQLCRKVPRGPGGTGVRLNKRQKCALVVKVNSILGFFS